MNVYLNKISGIDDAIISMFMSKRTWTRELENDIRYTCQQILNPISGSVISNVDTRKKDWGKFSSWMNTLIKLGTKHITLLRYINFSITVEGLHRGGQDDWDTHAKRFDNRIIRSSTRLARFGNEMSSYYKGKIMSTDMALAELGIEIPSQFRHDGKNWVKVVNGYVCEEYEKNKDVLRGLYMLSIPSNFIFNVNLTEWAHIYKERNENGGANPEVKECCEKIADLIESSVFWFDRELFLNIKN